MENAWRCGTREGKCWPDLTSGEWPSEEALCGASWITPAPVGRLEFWDFWAISLIFEDQGAMWGWITLGLQTQSSCAHPQEELGTNRWLELKLGTWPQLLPWAGAVQEMPASCGQQGPWAH